MLWIVLAVVALLFMAGVAIHFSRIEKIQNACMESLENFRGHHDELMRQTVGRHSQKMAELEERHQATIATLKEESAALKNKVDSIELAKAKAQEKFKSVCDQYASEALVHREEKAALESEIADLLGTIVKVKEAIKDV